MGMRTPAALALVLAAGVLGCSKTQDTAPATRIFGDPPKIGAVNFQATTQNFNCDITVTTEGFLCQFGGVPLGSYRFSPGPTVNVDIGYTQFQFEVQVTDPQSTAAQNDILLVTASFQTPPGQGQAEETSLLLLDDGSDFHFPWSQTQEPLDICPVLTPPCTCLAGRYNLTSNDVTAGDNTYTRGFGFITAGATIPPNGGRFVESCIAKVRHQAPFSASSYVGSDVPFKIEATDREGSITEWPDKPVGHVDATTWACNGDPCACCLATIPDVSACKGKDGLIATTASAGWPIGTGFCITAL